MVKNVDWASQTCIFGWPVQGIWPKTEDVSAVEPTSIDRSDDRCVLAIGNDQGYIKLSNFPNLSKNVSYYTFLLFMTVVVFILLLCIRQFLNQVEDILELFQSVVLTVLVTF